MAMLVRLQADLTFEIEELDIESDDNLLKRYQWLIPVIEADGRELARAPIREAELRRVTSALFA